MTGTLNHTLDALVAQVPKGPELRAARERGRNARRLTYRIKHDVELLEAYRNGLEGREYAFEHAEHQHGEVYPLSAWIEIDYLREMVDDQLATINKNDSLPFPIMLGFRFTHSLREQCYRH